MSYYTVKKIEDAVRETRSDSQMQFVRDFFEKADREDPKSELNWLLLSTSGVHGSYLSLKTIKDNWKTSSPEDKKITMLIICPRTVGILYGNVPLDCLADIDWLRERVTKSLENITASQFGNTYTEEGEEQP